MSVQLRKGKTKTILESSIDAALLAVEVYNKPRTTFRSEGYITLMTIAWTRLFHAYFNHTIGDKYYYRKKNGRFKRVDGEKKAWELATCIKKYSNLDPAIQKNLDFFIKLRNKIEHRHIDRREVDVLIFGECQSFLYNYENFLIKIFGKDYAINEALVYSLQFSQLRTQSQLRASKSILSSDLQDLVEYIKKYRSALSDEIFNSQEYSIKLLQIPKVSNTKKNDLAIEFVRLDQLSEEDKELYDQITVLVKDRTVKVEGSNVGRLKPGMVVNQVNSALGSDVLNTSYHSYIYTIFDVRPKKGADDPFDTNTEYCYYDEPHSDYVYNEKWVEFLIHILQTDILTIDKIKKKYKSNEKLDISEYSP